MARFSRVAHTERGLDRLINFTDAVVAIAATLLVLPIVEIYNDALSGTGDLESLYWDPQIRLALRQFSLVVGFTWMTVLWSHHHEIFERVKDYSLGLITLNFLWLMAMVFFTVPVGLIFSPEILYSNGIAALYLANLGVIFVLLALTKIYVFQHPQLLIDPSQKLGKKYFITVFISPAILFVGAFAALFVGTWALPIFFLIIPIYYVIDRYKPPPPPQTERGMDRVVNFSDAVVAIAITLLILPLVDDIKDLYSSPDVSLGEITAKAITFALVFWLMSRQWLINHRLFENVKDYSQPLLRLTFLWLLFMVLVVIPSNLMGEGIVATGQSTQESQALTAVAPNVTIRLGLWFGLIALMTAFIARHLQRHPELLVDPSQPPSPRASYYTAILYFALGALGIPLYLAGYGSVAYWSFGLLLLLPLMGRWAARRGAAKVTQP